ncbi:MAG: sigma-70 family RNA polymerase sigma factor [Candidatus Aminicenantes bacterium]|nr:MAG: sigma-70 family RNA polymerase sigma factor [Candidatus Aminicenantes bacterium]
MEEKELVRRTMQGDEEAFGVLVKKYKTKVFNLAHSLTRDRDAADDLAQESFIKAYFALPRFKLKSEFGTWLYRIAINTVKDYLRKKGRIKEIAFEKEIEHLVIQEDEMEKKQKKQREEQNRRLVHHTIKTMPEKYQLILSLRDIQGFSYREIADILKVSPGTVDSRLHRARRNLRKKIGFILTQKGGTP